MTMRALREVAEKVPLDMTPMIDVVFQLLIFFVMTLRIVEAEGDFQIRMPHARALPGIPQIPLPPIKLRLEGDSNGDLVGIQLNHSQLVDFAALHAKVQELVEAVGDATQSGPIELEIDSDPDLRYAYVVAAITAVSGSRDDLGVVVPMIERINFAPPRLNP